MNFFVLIKPAHKKVTHLLPAVILNIALCSMPHAVFAEGVNIQAEPIDFSTLSPNQVQYDELYWRGGLVLKSKGKNFGGFSGIELSADGKNILAISDRGYWLKASLDYKDGKPVSLGNAHMAPLLNAKGKRFKYWEIDSEGITKRNDSLSDVVVSFERVQAIYRYKLGERLIAKAKEWGRIADAKKISSNKGLESITSLPASHKYRGWMLAIAERKLNPNGDHSAWLVNGKENHALFIKRYSNFDITDANYLPNGDIVILERAISVFSGAQMRIRQICGSRIKPGATVEGKTLLDADWSLNVDNMEGLGVHQAANGETILSVISDNNFHFLQRNLFLQFALVDNRSVC